MENNFASNLKYLRLQSGLTQEELANKLDKDYSTIGKWELGQRSPIMTDVIKISELFNISLEKLIGTSIIEDSKINNDNVNLSALDDVLYSHKDKIDSVKNLPIEKQKIIANAVESVLAMIDNSDNN